MKARSPEVAAVALALMLGGTAFAGDTRQLAASAGLDPAEAADLTTYEIVELKFYHDARRDDRHVVVVPVSADPAARVQLASEAGLSWPEAETMTLTELAMAKDYREARQQDRVPLYHSSADARDGAGREQIVLSLGLDPDAVATMTVDEIYLVTVREGDMR
jgi:hypothetical protein